MNEKMEFTRVPDAFRRKNIRQRVAGWRMLQGTEGANKRRQRKAPTFKRGPAIGGGQ